MRSNHPHLGVKPLQVVSGYARDTINLWNNLPPNALVRSYDLSASVPLAFRGAVVDPTAKDLRRCSGQPIYR